MRPLPDAEIFDRDALRRLGWSNSAVSRVIRSGRLTRVRHGQLALAGPVDERIAALAAAADIAGAVISHRSALIMHDLPIVGPRPPLPEVTVPPNRLGSARRVHLHRATLAAQDVTVIDGTFVTSAARTVVDEARHRSTAAAVAAMDAALHRRLTTVADIEAVILRCWNWPGIRRANRAVRLADGRAESPLESVSRLVIGWLRLPPPDLQPTIRAGDGHMCGRLDFYWDAFGVAGEADGRGKYQDRDDAYPAEKERQESMEDLGVTFARWGWPLATRRPHELRAKIESAFARGRARDRSGLPRGWSVTRAEPVI
jgi:hypothetical protein